MVEFFPGGAVVEKAGAPAALASNTVPDGGPGARRPRRRLRRLDVHFISLVPAAANQRDFLVKSAKEGQVLVEKQVRVLKADTVRRMVYGIVYAPAEVDTDGDTMEAEDIEKAAYAFMQKGRVQKVDSDHDGEAGKGFVAESWIVRKGDPLFPDEAEGAWAVGIKVTDEATWGRVEKGELKGLSMAGLAQVENVDADESEEEPAGDVSKADAKGVILWLRKKLGLEEDPGANGRENGQQDGVQKGLFAEKLVTDQMWRFTSALSDAIRAVMEDEEVTDKVAGVDAVISEFRGWLVNALGQTQTDAGDLVGKRATAVATPTGDGGLNEALERVRKDLAEIAARLEAVERQSAGRQTRLGDRPVEKEQKFKGIRFF